MLEDLTSDQIAVLTELVIHHGMYRHKKESYKYEVYYKIATELFDEMTEKKELKKWYGSVFCEFMEAQFKTVKEVEE